MHSPLSIFQLPTLARDARGCNRKTRSVSFPLFLYVTFSGTLQPAPKDSDFKMSKCAIHTLARLSIAATVAVALSGCQYPDQLSAFTSDGCSSFPDGPPDDPQRWRNCCYEHDQAYWLGGSAGQRAAADTELKTCVAEVENETLARAMWLGVRAGGSPYWPTAYRWAYGWPYTRGYRRVTDEERQTAESLLHGAPPTAD